MPTNYKAIVFDFDGTAVHNGPGAMPSPGLIAAISAAQATGAVKLFAASGRSVEHAMPVIEALNLTEPCVLNGGAIIIEPATGHVIHEALLTPGQLEAIGRIAIDAGFTPRSNRDPSLEPSFTGFDPNQPASIVWVPHVPSEQLIKLLQTLIAIPGVMATSARGYTGGHVINITTTDGTKEHGVARALTDLGIKRAQTIGVGDGDNDIHLFAATGLHIALDNATDQLKAAADLIAPSVHDDGLAWVIRTYGQAS